MKSLLLLLLLLVCLNASAATPWPTEPPGVKCPPRPPLFVKKLVVKKPAKKSVVLHSPRQSALQKMSKMLVPASVGAVTEPPLLPMLAFHNKVQSEFGSEEFIAQALQPANQSILFEFSLDMRPNSWAPLAGMGPFPYDQQVIAGLITDQPFIFIRAKATPTTPSEFSPASAVMSGLVWINPKVRGASIRIVSK